MIRYMIFQNIFRRYFTNFSHFSMQSSAHSFGKTVNVTSLNRCDNTTTYAQVRSYCVFLILVALNCSKIFLKIYELRLTVQVCKKAEKRNFKKCFWAVSVFCSTRVFERCTHHQAMDFRRVRVKPGRSILPRRRGTSIFVKKFRSKCRECEKWRISR